MKSTILRSLIAAATILVFGSSFALAASYQRTDDTIVDPILLITALGGGPHPYAGPNLEPFAILAEANLTGADLIGADLTGADLSFADLIGADLSDADLSFALLFFANLTGADLSSANLSFANLTGADLSSADLTGADLSFAILTGANLTGAQYDEFTVFPSGDIWDVPPWGLDGGITPWEAGMIPVPEPSAGSLLLFGAMGLAGLALRRDYPASSRSRT